MTVNLTRQSDGRTWTMNHESSVFLLPPSGSEALLLQSAHTALGIAGNCKYLFNDDGTVKQMQMSNAAVSNPTSSAAYIRPVATITVTNN